MQLLPYGKKTIFGGILLFNCFILTCIVAWMRTPISSCCAQGQRPCMPRLKPKSTRRTPWIALLGVLEIVVCWYTALKCYVSYLAGTFGCGLHVLWKALFSLGRKKEDLRGLRLPWLASEILCWTVLGKSLASGVGGERYRPLEMFQ